MPWKYHHGMPFCVLTTMVSGPRSGVSCGASAVRPCALTPRKTTSAGSDRREIAGDRRPDLEVAVRARDAQPALLHRPQVRAAREQHDVDARHGRAGETRADVAADRARSGNDDLHAILIASVRERLGHDAALNLAGRGARNRVGDVDLLRAA